MNMNDFSVEPSGPNFFCSSLKQRDEWATATAELLRSSDAELLQSGESKWQETNIGTHDIELSLPQVEDYNFCHQNFRLILLSPQDTENPATASRIDKLLRFRKGRNSAVVFLLDEGRAEEAYQAFTTLQMKVLTANSITPIIPLPSTSALIPFLETLQASLVTSNTAHHHPWPVDAARELLPYCTVTPAALSQQTTQVLGENILDFKELISLLGEQEGRDMVCEAVGVEEVERLISFWTHEFSAR